MQGLPRVKSGLKLSSVQMPETFVHSGNIYGTDTETNSSRKSTPHGGVSFSPVQLSPVTGANVDSTFDRQNIFSCKFFSSFLNSSIKFRNVSLVRPRILNTDFLVDLIRKDSCLKASFHAVTTKGNLVFDKKKPVVIVADMEGEFLSLIAAMKKLFSTSNINLPMSVSKDANDIPYIKFDLSQLQDHKKLIFLGDILDRGPFGMINLVTLFKLFGNQNSFLEKTFILGNHDLPYLLLPSDADHVSIKLIQPSIFTAEGDSSFSLACDIFKQMNEKGYLKLVEYDPDLAQLTCHAVFTAGDHGFLKKFQNFLSQSKSFRDFLISKKGIDQKIVTMLIEQPNFSDWKDKGPDHFYMQHLVDVINCLIDKDYIDDEVNRAAVKDLLMDRTKIGTEYIFESFVMKLGIFYEKEVQDGEDVTIFYANFKVDCYPLPGIRQVNGHWHAKSRDPGILRVKGPFGESEIVKLDCASSSQMIPGGSVSYPSVFYTDAKLGFQKSILTYHSNKEKFDNDYFLKQLKIRLKNDQSLHSLKDLGSMDASEASVINTPDGNSYSKMPKKAKVLLAEFLNSRDKKLRNSFVKNLNEFTDLDKVHSKFYNEERDNFEINDYLFSIENLFSRKPLFRKTSYNIKVNDVFKEYLKFIIELCNQSNV